MLKILETDFFITLYLCFHKLLQMSIWGTFQISIMELFCDRLKAMNYFHKKSVSQMFDMSLLPKYAISTVC